MRRGFTLIELLIVIAIIAILAVAAVLVLNPAQLLKEGRDSTRMSDLSTLNSAIALYLADVNTLSLTATSTCGRASFSGGGIPISDSATTTCSFNISQKVDGTGWIPINFESMTSGQPLTKLPVDPLGVNASNVCTGTNNACMYYYRATSTTVRYLLGANMESIKYSKNGSRDVESTDGGSVSEWYEVGTYLGTAF